MLQLHVVFLQCFELLVDTSLLFSLNQTFVFVLCHGSPHVIIQFLLLQVELLLCLGKLPSDRVDEDFFLFKYCEE